ncbi:MAG: HEAT repeat domain-containing protein, partial [Verrucomicrobiae bacterium]|nr:HEAT repeat domain-containing protein [Verrucomicrobiae bacterium]
GDDRYRATQYAQAAATFGTAVLWADAQKGETAPTIYSAEGLAQGFASVGGTAVLFDRSGGDHYQATGYDECGWLPGHRFTLAQGFGYGLRPWAGGGLGMLVDLSGDDLYEADVYGQGAAYWYAIGMLLDAAGNDRYRAYQYCQGAGIHLAAGLLADWAGDDEWSAHAICQGGAHDYSVGLLVDRNGNDRYRGHSTAQGTAIHNSFALLLDRRGDDVYDGGAPTQAQAAGHDGGRRQFGSIALLLDLGGNDSFSQKHPANSAWIKPWYGCGWDTEASSDILPAQPRNPPQRATPDSPSWLNHTADPHHPIERLLRLANSERSDAAGAWDQLKADGVNALRYLVTRLDSPDVMVRVRTEDLVDHLGEAAIPILIEGIVTARNTEQARVCAYFLARFPTATNAIPHLLPLLKRADMRSTAFYTLGHLRAREAIPASRRALRDRNPTVRMRAAQALGRIGDKAGTPLLLRALDDDWWHVRYAAQDALVAIGAAHTIRRALPNASSRARPHLIEALAKTGDCEALDWQRRFPLSEPTLQATRLAYLEKLILEKTAQPRP